MSTTDTTPSADSGLVPGPAGAVDDRTGQESVWGAPPPGSAGWMGDSAETVQGGSDRARWPQTVKTKVAALLAAAGLIVGGAAGAAVGHSTAGTATPAGRTGQFGGPGGGTQGGFGGPGAQSGPGQSGTGAQSGTGQAGTSQSGSGPAGAVQPGSGT